MELLKYLFKPRLELLHPPTGHQSQRPHSHSPQLAPNIPAIISLASSRFDLWIVTRHLETNLLHKEATKIS